MSERQQPAGEFKKKSNYDIAPEEARAWVEHLDITDDMWGGILEEGSSSDPVRALIRIAQGDRPRSYPDMYDRERVLQGERLGYEAEPVGNPAFLEAEALDLQAWYQRQAPQVGEVTENRGEELA